MVEFRFLLSCARVVTGKPDEAAIRAMLADGIDWTAFTRQALDHGLASLAGHTLARVAPDALPDELLDAFRAMVEQTRARNSALFEELCAILAALSQQGVEAIPFKGPILALQAYGDLGLRVFRGLDLLIRDGDLTTVTEALGGLGFERRGEDIVLKQETGTAVQLHTRLVPGSMALDIDYAGLWRRARRTELQGRPMVTLAPEDELLALAVHGGKELWRSMRWACDVAVFLGAQPGLDWDAALERARAQGCLRLVLLAAALARRYFGAAVPGAVAAAERADPVIAAMAGPILARWQMGDAAEEPTAPPGDKTLSLERLRLHDGLARQARYVARTVSLPSPESALPLWRACGHALECARAMPYALAGSSLALTLMPAPAETKRTIRQQQQARVAAERTLAQDPASGPAWHKLGDALAALKRTRRAIECYDKAIAAYEKALIVAPDNGGVWGARSVAMKAIGKKADIPAIALNPQDADAWALRAGALWFSRRFDDAAQASDCALTINPRHLAATRIGIRSRVNGCIWHQRDEDKRRIADGLRDGLNITVPFNHRAISDSEAESLMIARLVAERYPSQEPPLWRGEKFRHDRIRVAYLSAEFLDHPMTYVMAGVYEHHDRTRFETTAISYGPNDGGKMRRRIEGAFDRFIDVANTPDTDIAAMMRAMEIDIAVDLSGYAGSGRPGILAHRPAPVQVNYLAYAGTMGLPYIDYIIADPVVIPEENRIHYTEHVAYLPHTYMPNDRTRPVAASVPTRAEAGLPETGFVFACHNTEHKFGPELFDIWMRLLRANAGSVLWLKSLNPSATDNLRREAKARGVAPDRLVFAPRVARIEDHLARLSLADLFVDTLPYNAHATACDALWAGLPVLTCMGHTFAGRVAASVLYAIGLPELVTKSPSEYEAVALALAKDPERLAAIKAKLMRNRDTEPLFDTARFTRDLESAYVTMWERQQAGLPPTGFAVKSALAYALAAP